MRACADVREYCDWESFNASCASGSVVNIKAARYGRMEVDRDGLPGGVWWLPTVLFGIVQIVYHIGPLSKLRLAQILLVLFKGEREGYHHMCWQYVRCFFPPKD